MQAVLAPFAVGAPGCAGDEARLVDCPVEVFKAANATSGAPCDPYGDSYAFVACGNADATAGARLPLCTMPCSDAGI